MANTRRTKAELLALIADNATGNISAQDVRDFLVTVMGGYASLKTIDGSTAQTGIGTTPVLFTQWDTNGDFNGLLPDHITGNDITIDIAGVYHLNCAVSFAGSGSTTFELHLYINGTEADEGLHRKIGTGGDIGSASFSGIVPLAALDVLTVYIEADGTNKEVTVADGQFVVNQIA